MGGTAIPAVGEVWSELTVAVAVDVQLLTVLVTVRMYVPGKFTTGSSRFEVKPFGPDHAKVTLDVVEPPLRVRFVARQVSVPPTALLFGTTVLPVTVAEAVAVQPLEVLVTSRV